jgi:hypothetical protein
MSLGGSGGRNVGGDGGRAGGGPCDVGCVPDEQNLCESSEVTWVCEGRHDEDLFRDECEELGTSSLLRYCCPKQFLADCRNGP